MKKQARYRAIGEKAVVSIVSGYLKIWVVKPPCSFDCVLSKGCVQGMGAAEEAELL